MRHFQISRIYSTMIVRLIANQNAFTAIAEFNL